MNMVKNFAVAITLGCILILLSACGDGEPEGKWLDAPDAFGVYQASARVEAIGSKSGPPDTSCEAVIDEAREMLDQPQTSGFKVMAKYCSNAGMAFAREIRCAEGSFQVKCE
jgi:hypothetical protein